MKRIIKSLYYNTRLWATLVIGVAEFAVLFGGMCRNEFICILWVFVGLSTFAMIIELLERPMTKYEDKAQEIFNRMYDWFLEETPTRSE